MAETINYAPLLPTEPPKDLVGWTIQQGAFPKEYLIYKAGWRYLPLEDRNEPAVEVHCTACERTFLAEKVPAGGCYAAYAPAPFGWRHAEMSEAVISGNDTLCPFCGQAAETVHIGRIPNGITAYAYTTQVTTVGVDGQKDRLAILDWQVCRHITKNGRESYSARAYEAYVVDERKIVRLTGYDKMFCSTRWHPLEQRSRYSDGFCLSHREYPWKPAILEGTTAENCKLDRYIADGGKRLVSYLALWRKRPVVENLVMSGMSSLVDELIDTEAFAGIPKLQKINWKAKKPHLMLHMEKDYFRRVGRSMSKLQYELYLWAKEHGVCEELSPDDFLPLEWVNVSRSELLKIAGAGDCLRTARYLYRQRASVIIYRDYLDMAAKLDMDMTDSSVRYPKNLKAAHDRVMVRYNERKTTIAKAAFTKRRKELDKLAWICDGILIRTARSAAELKREGSALHHCVASYADRHAEGKTAIFFIRREDAPNKPWYTLELDEQTLKVRQNRGSRNCARTPEITAFEEKWLEWLRAERKKSSKKEVKKGAKAA